MTGAPPPPGARKLVELWRPLIEDRAGADLDRLENVLEDQRRFGDTIHDLLDSLDMGEDRSSDEGDDEEGEAGDQDQQPDSGKEGESDDSGDMQRAGEEAEVSAEETPDASAEAVDAPSAEMSDDSDMGDSEAPAEPWRPRNHGANEPRGPDYRAFVSKFDETVAAEDL